MGIDIYASWATMTKHDKEAQLTGFSSKGHVGYLREAYHGGPYATRVLVPEAFDADSCEAQIPADLLWERMPYAMFAALVREAEIYGDSEARAILCEIGHEPKLANGDDPAFIRVEDDEQMGDVLSHIVKCLADARAVGEGTSKQPTGKLPFNADILRRAMAIPMVLSLACFAALCRAKEQETGEPCTIYASY